MTKALKYNLDLKPTMAIMEEELKKQVLLNGWCATCMDFSIPESILEKYKDEFTKSDWDAISSMQTLSPMFMYRNQNNINWEHIVSSQVLPESLIERCKDKINFNDLASYQELSNDFIAKYEESLSLTDVARFQNLNDEMFKTLIELKDQSINDAMFINECLTKEQRESLFQSVNLKSALLNGWEVSPDIVYEYKEHLSIADLDELMSISAWGDNSELTVAYEQSLNEKVIHELSNIDCSRDMDYVKKDYFAIASQITADFLSDEVKDYFSGQSPMLSLEQNEMFKEIYTEYNKALGEMMNDYLTNIDAHYEDVVYDEQYSDGLGRPILYTEIMDKLYPGILSEENNELLQDLNFSDRFARIKRCEDLEQNHDGREQE